ncbi:ABC transporter permease [Brucella gallinifaecis]|uniref:ABC transporter permease n=1 Tax=Brucella gallinifaecis TaxID=215590 RepID=A0A502BK37_9HYPH|nr:ABC transporter permease [Brucella gallinifaecis]TPF74029.1 ABC transporter permease [Brucella gallinifaecis]
MSHIDNAKTIKSALELSDGQPSLDQAHPPKRKSKWLIGNIPLLIALLVYISVIAIIEPAFLSPFNIRNVLLQVSVAGIVTLGMTMVIISGQIDLSVGYLIAFVACVMAALLQMGWSAPVVAIVGLLMSVFFQSLVGFVISRIKVESFIITLGAMSIYRGFALLMTSGAEIPLGGNFQTLGRSRIFEIPLPVYIFLGLCILCWFILTHTVFGRRLYAVGENNDAAYLAGINVQNFKVRVFALHGLLVGIAALILMSRIGVGAPNMAAGLELETIAASVVGGAALAGGRGSIIGSFLGVIFLGIISNSMNIIGVSTFWQYVMLGGVVIFAVVLSSVSRNNR